MDRAGLVAQQLVHPCVIAQAHASRTAAKERTDMGVLIADAFAHALVRDAQHASNHGYVDLEGFDAGVWIQFAAAQVNCATVRPPYSLLSVRGPIGCPMRQ